MVDNNGNRNSEIKSILQRITSLEVTVKDIKENDLRHIEDEIKGLRYWGMAIMSGIMVNLVILLVRIYYKV